jgi:hypothetical protein
MKVLGKAVALVIDRKEAYKMGSQVQLGNRNLKTRVQVQCLYSTNVGTLV